MDSAPDINKENFSEYDPSKPIESLSGRYGHGGASQEEREKSSRLALKRLEEDQIARRNYLVGKLDTSDKSFNAKEYLELQGLLSSTGDLKEEERIEIAEKMQKLN